MIFHVFFTDALNSIENSIYRTAFKLRSVQTLCQCKYRFSWNTWNNLTLMCNVKFIENQKHAPCEWLLDLEGWTCASTLLVTENMECGRYTCVFHPHVALLTDNRQLFMDEDFNSLKKCSYLVSANFLFVYSLFRIPILTQNKITK